MPDVAGLPNPIERVIKAAGGSVIKGALEVVDRLTTSEAERNELRIKLLTAENEFLTAISAHEAQIAAERAKVLVAEAESESWMARNWRPLLMLTVSAIIAFNYLLVPMLGHWLPITTAELPSELWTMLEVGVGGYMVGRTLEKISPTIRDGIAARKSPQ